MGVVVALSSTDTGFNVFFQKSNNLEAQGNSLSREGVKYEVFVLVLFLWKLIDKWGNQNGDGKVYQLSVDWWEYLLLSLICCFLHPCYHTAHGGLRQVCLYPHPLDKVTSIYFKTCGVGVPALSATQPVIKYRRIFPCIYEGQRYLF